MYYRVEWTEDGTNFFRRIYKARDFNTMWKAVYYMNCERKETGRPVMKQMQITAQKKCDDGYFEVTGRYESDMALDTATVDRTETKTMIINEG